MTELKSKMGIIGRMHLQLFDSDGKLKEERFYENTVTELGDAHVANRVAGSGHAVLGWMSIGTGNGQGTASTGLAAVLDRNALTSVTQGGGGADNDVVFIGDWIAGDGTGAITEAGIFRLDDDATMNYYQDFGVVTKGALDTLKITWTVQYGAS